MRLRVYIQVHPNRESKRPYVSFLPPNEARLSILEQEGYRLFHQDLEIPIPEYEGECLPTRVVLPGSGLEATPAERGK